LIVLDSYTQNIICVYPLTRLVIEVAMKNKKLQINLTGTTLITGLCALLFISLTMAQPQGGHVTGGQGVISTSGNTTQIQQQTHNLAIDWQSFNVGAQEMVRFLQPSTTSTALNRILDQNPSQIFGSIQANGRVILSNPNGMFFSKTAEVNVGALIASGININTDDFMQGNYQFSALADQATGVVVNHGLLQAATGGSISLLGGTVSNEGFIIADYGQINLVAGKQVTIDFDGDGLMRFSVDEAVLENAAGISDAVNNSGTLSAQGGEVLLTARVASRVFDNAVNNEGIIEAGRIENVGGVVRLSGLGGNTLHSGSINVAGQTPGDNGGNVQVLGDDVALLENASIDASGDSGGGTVLVGGDYQGNNTAIQNAEMVYVNENSSINANANVNGDGGRVIVWADDTATVSGSGNITAQGGATSGNGGFIETSGKQFLEIGGAANASAPNGSSGTWLLDPNAVEIVSGTGVDASAGGTFNSSQIDSDTIVTALASGTSVIINTSGTDDATAGDITVNSGLENMALGDSVTAVSLTLTAHNDITLDSTGGGISVTNAGTRMLDLVLTADSDNNNGGTAVNGATGGNIIIDSNIDTNGGSFTSSGVNFDFDNPANSVINTDGGIVSLNHTGTVTVGNNGETINTTGTTNGTISISAADIDLNGGTAPFNLNSGDAAITLTPTSGTAITLGADTNFGLTDNNLDSIFTTGVLTIGNTSAGAITISSAINAGGISTLHLVTGSTVGQSNTLTETNLAIEAADAVTLTQANDVDSLAINTSTGDIQFTDSDGFTVDTVDSITGIDTDVGSVSLTATTGTLLVSNTTATNDIDATTGIAITLSGDDALFTVGSNADVETTSGGIVVTADKMNLIGNLTANTQNVTLNPRTTDAINLGATGDSTANTLELSDGELDRVTAGTLIIGDASAGAISISSAINAANTLMLHLVTGGTVGQTNTLTETSLAIEAAGAVSLTQANDVDNLAINTSTGNIQFTDSNGFSVTTVDSITGIDTNSGSVTLTATTGDLSVTNTTAINDIEATGLINITLSEDDKLFTVASGADVETTANNIIVTADKMNFLGDLTALTGSVTLNSLTSDSIDLGSTGGAAINTLELSDTELDNINAGTLIIGDTAAGAISISSAINAGNVSTLHLVTGGTVSQDAAATLTETGLAIEAAGAVTLTQANNVTNLAINTSTGNIQFTDSNGFTATTVDGVTGINTNSGSVTLSASSGSLILNNGITTADSTITLNGLVSIGAGISLSTGSGAGDILFNNTLSGGNSLVLNAGTGNISLSTVNSLTSLDVNTSGVLTLNGNVTTSGNADFAGVTGGTSLASVGLITITSNTEDIIFADGIISSAISGSGSLSLVANNATNGHIFLGDVGTSGASLGGLSLNTGNGNDLTLYGSIYTNGGLNFANIGTNGNGDVIIADGATVILETTSDDGNILFSDNASTFNTAINGDVLNSGSLTINAGGGTVKLAQVGQVQAIDLLTVNTTGEFSPFEAIETTGDISFSGMTSTFNKSTASIFNGFGLFGNAAIDIMGPGGLIVDTTRTVDLRGPVQTAGGNINIITTGASSHVAIRDSLTSEGGNVVIDAGSYVYINDDTTYNGKINTTDSGLAGNGGNVTISSDNINYIRGAIVTDGGQVLLDSVNRLEILNNGSSLNGSVDTSTALGDGGLVNITASDFYLTGTINSGTATTTISDIAGGIRLGSGSNGALEIDNTELGYITTGELILSSVNDVHFYGDRYDFSGPEIFTIVAPNTYIYDFVNLVTTMVDYDFSATDINEGIIGDDSRLRFGQDTSFNDINGNVKLGNIGQTNPINFLLVNTTGEIDLSGDITAIGLDLAAIETPSIVLSNDVIIDTSLPGSFNYLDLTNTSSLSSIDGNYSLTLNAGTGRVYIGNVGQSSPLTGLDVTTSGNTFIFGAVDSQGDINIISNGVEIRNAITAQGYAIGIDAGDFDLNTTNGALNTGTGLGSVVINGTSGLDLRSTDTNTSALDISEAELRRITTETLTLSSPLDVFVRNIDASNPALVDIGAIVLQSGNEISMGAPVVFNNLTALADNGIFVNANLTTTGDLILDADANDTPDGNDNITMGSGGELTSGGSLILAATSGDGIVLDGDFTIIHNGTGLVDLSDIAVNSDPSQSNLYKLTINAALNNSDIILSDVGTTLALSGLEINNGDGLVSIGGELVTRGDISLSTNQLELFADTIINTSGGNGALDFSALNINGDNSGFYSLDLLTGGGAITLSEVGTSAMLSSLSINSTGQTLLTGDVRLAGLSGIDMSAATTLSLSGAITLDTRAGNGAVNFSSGVTDGDLIILAGSGEVSLGSSGKNTDLATLVVDTAGQINLGGNVSTTAGDVDFSNGTNMVLNSNVIIDSAGAVNLSGVPVTGNGALTILANGGAATLDGIGTLATPLTSLSVTSSGPTSLGGNIYTADNIDLTGADSIILNANVLMNSGTGSIDLSTSPVSGSGELTLQANAGVSLDVVNGSGALIVDSSQLNLLGDLSIDGIIDFSTVATVSLGADVIMDTRGGNGTVILNGGSLDGNQILTILSGNGPVTFGDIGQLIPLAGLDITTTGTVNLNGSIMTQGDIDLANVNTLVLLSDSEIDSSTNDGLINLFGVDVNGPFQLALNAGAGNVFLGSVGESVALTGLSIIGAETQIGSSITTDGDVDLSETSLEGEVSLVINAGTGGVALGGVGQSTALKSLTATGSGQSLLNGNITTQGSTGLDLSGLVNILLGDNITIDSSVNNGAINLGGSHIDGPFALIINAANGTSTLGTMGQANSLSSLTVNATGQTYLAGNITTQGPDGINLTHAKNIDLIGDVILTSETTGGAITLDGGAVDGNFALTIDTGNLGTLLLGPVGQNDPLASLTIIGDGITTLGADISTQGTAGIDLSAARSVLMTTDITLDTSTGDGEVKLTGGAVDGNFVLNINSGNGNIQLADMGQVDALASLIVTGTGSTDLNGDITSQGVDGIDLSAASNINLSNDVSLDTTLTDGSLNLSGASVDGNFNLVLIAGLGEISLGSMGQSTALASLGVTSQSQLNLLESIAVNGNLSLTAGEIIQAQTLSSNAGNISLVSASSITMANTASSRTPGGTVDYAANDGSIGLAELDAGEGEVNLSASVDILSIYGSFTNLLEAPVNIFAGQTSLVAGDRIGSSSREPITLDVATGGSISVSLGADKAYINNINRSFISGPDAGNVIDVLADRLEAAAQGQSTTITNSADAQATALTGEEEDSQLLIVDRPDFLTEYSEEERTEESTRSLIPDVPLLVRTKDGWAFKRGARSAIDEEEERKRKQRTVDWL